MIERAIDDGVRFGWVTADEAYGENVRCAPGWKNNTSATWWRCRELTVVNGGRPAARTRWPPCARGGWQPISSGAGSKGPRFTTGR